MEKEEMFRQVVSLQIIVNYFIDVLLIIEPRYKVLVARPPQDVDVLAVRDFPIPIAVLRVLLCISEVGSPTTKDTDEN